MEKEVLVSSSKIKLENSDEEMKEYAETAMNELLGWYGYGIGSNKLTRNTRCGSNSSSSHSPKYTDACDWCGKIAEDSKRLATAGTIYCSELCFSQSRRANFKRNKTCDWCRHVRHTVSYVDFQDGASQLQFCSDKCLNQYKMQLFCRETRAHLELHPHREEISTTGGALITPDLWMRNCKSPGSPQSSSPPPPLDGQPVQTSPLPLVTKMLRQSPTEGRRRQRGMLRKVIKKSCSTVTSRSLSVEAPEDLRVRCTTPIEESKEPMKEETNKCEATSSEKKTNMSSLNSLLPPVTILVPHPIIIPLPLPIPIPIFLPMKRGAEEKSTNTSHFDETEETKDNIKTDENLNEQVISRPLRKRKKITNTIQPKTKVASMKSKKFLSV